jgi:7-alpha-hydroxysteroid dehydrogenase
MSFSLDGKTAIITGAANGIGLAIARHFVEQGANVMFADMDEDNLKREIQDLNDQDNVAYFAGDLRERLTIANLLSATIDAFDGVDILVNASRQVLTTDPLDNDDTSVDDLIEQNVLTSLRLSQQVAKRMIKQSEGQKTCGSIVNLSSLAARLTRPDLLAYSMSTAALEQMTRSLAVAFAEHGIRVNAVAFGSVMSASLQAHLKDTPKDRDIIEQATPLGRIASAHELAETVQYLASDAAQFMTGQIISLDGGRGIIDTVETSAH